MALSKKKMAERKKEERVKPKPSLNGINILMSNLNGNDVKPKSSIILAEYHPIFYALADPEKRKKLEAICASLKAFNQLENVSYGIPHPIPMSRVSELLEAFR